ncbi:MAG: ATP-binding protein [Haloarculaceae archaeon]
MVVVGRTRESGPTGRLGRYRARDGSAGAPVDVDFDRPHAGLVVGKRGAGKSHTLGVLAEGLARARGVVPVVADPMGAFGGLGASPVGARVCEPRVRAGALGPREWCRLLDLDPAGGPGGLVWRAASECETLTAMRAAVGDADAAGACKRAAANHLDLAAAWDVFDPAGLDATALTADPVVLDLSGRDRAPAGAVVAAVATTLYEARLAGEGPLPWLLVDEAHALFDGVAAGPLRRLATRGRQPGVSLVAATQRPGALPAVAVSQSDLLVAHRLTDRADREALVDARPTYFEGSLAERLPTRRGEALVLDDATESAHAVRVRERETPHEGESPRASREGGGDR